MSFRRTRAVIDLKKLAENFRLLKARVEGGGQGNGTPSAFLCPMVKANAYGHGVIRVAERLRKVGAKTLGVGLIEEGLELRASGDQGEILQFGPFDREGAKMMFETTLTPMVSTFEELEFLRDVAAANMSALRVPQHAKTLTFHLKINTGMNRLGIHPKEVAKAAAFIAKTPSLQLTGVATHFAEAEDAVKPHGHTRTQWAVFEKSIAELRAAGLTSFAIHFANSAALAGFKNAELAQMKAGGRPGIALYGIEHESTDEKQAETIGVQPILELVSEVAIIQDVSRGDTVSYGARWKAPRDSRIAVVPCGYADGYRRGLAGSSVLIRGERVPITGTICMDYLMCDITGVPDAKPGDKITLIGAQRLNSHSSVITAVELAQRLQTISYEIFTGIGERVPRVYVDGEA